MHPSLSETLPHGCAKNHCLPAVPSVERIHLKAARNLLQDAQTSIDTVARLTGFGHPENLRRTFHKHLAISPQAYSERFA
ncbi:helix-turn-helix domain-containing protein [Pseudomonas sp. UBA2684]|uniref:helix-turn-helix domain-containing protein n=1 Tax=Pseudomonas sp. UBA2684 TaxID=1947311 RepID=UPI0025FED48A|nr:helix-turn-helix domain-containing protein [Pseudomonas sp. UBA2684]